MIPLLFLFLICVVTYPSAGSYSYSYPTLTRSRLRNVSAPPKAPGHKPARSITTSLEGTAKRRDFIKASTAILPIAITYQPPSAKALSLPFTSPPSRRQLELCLVGVLRLRYWAHTVAASISESRRTAPPTGLTDSMKSPYLESRLGAKAALTGRIGGGANAAVRTLASLEIRGCLRDAAYWYDEYFLGKKNLAGESKERRATLRRRRVVLDAAAEDIVESLAAVVEFDGLENLQDASPRSSLALGMYDDSKARFIGRTLDERTVVCCDAFVDCFGGEERDVCERYVKVNYPGEYPRAEPDVGAGEILS